LSLTPHTLISEGCEEHVKYGAPSLEPVLLCRLGYALSHDADHKVPDWVAYHLTRDKVIGIYPRSNNFRPDPDLPRGERAELKDYDLCNRYLGIFRVRERRVYIWAERRLSRYEIVAVEIWDFGRERIWD